MKPPLNTDGDGSESHQWEHFHHEADIGIHGWGSTTASAFEQAALAMTAVITDPALVDPLEAVPIQCDAPDLDLLLPDWLNALIYEMAVRQMLFSRFHVEINGTLLHATAWGEKVDRPRHRPAVEVKGATYSELKVWRDESGQSHACCVVDV
jgi:tRNA nucleotidyltransferase (CCA-adding enzyme)